MFMRENFSNRMLIQIIKIQLIDIRKRSKFKAFKEKHLLLDLNTNIEYFKRKENETTLMTQSINFDNIKDNNSKSELEEEKSEEEEELIGGH